MSKWLAESIEECANPYDKARFAAGYAVLKDPNTREADDAESEQR